MWCGLKHVVPIQQHDVHAYDTCPQETQAGRIALGTHWPERTEDACVYEVVLQDETALLARSLVRDAHGIRLQNTWYLNNDIPVPPTLTHARLVRHTGSIEDWIYKPRTW